MSRYLNIILNVPMPQKFYMYLEPLDTEIFLTPQQNFGRRVEVPFGSRKLIGYVIETLENLPANYEVPVEKIRPAKKYMEEESLLTRELFDLARWMSSFYITNISECLFTMLHFGKKESTTPGFSFQEDETSFTKKTLSDEQTAAVDGIINCNQKDRFHYLYGMTGSGKTEVFLTCAEKIMEQGKGVIYLVPEIGLTPQVVEAVTQRFGNTAAVLHSELTPSQRLKEWKRILNKEARIVIGARSAVFAPVPDLGLIIIDEEHDSSYKSGSSPRYHARQVAMTRCVQNKIPLLMGSATPSVESWNGMANNLIIKHTLTRRLAGGAVPEIKSINLMYTGGDSSISKTLEKEIRSTISQNKQVILFLNRRGFTHFFTCHSCGFELKCRNCSVALTYHKSENRLRCHYCGYNLQPPHECPECGSLDVGYSGFGTEFIEAEVKSKFPNARILRIDTDSVSHKGEFAQKIEAFKNGEYDILLGTQMVAKGLNFPKLQLVGVVLADTALHLPDFRAAEKTFSLITQVAGRAGRFFPDGKVLVQSFAPDRDPISMSVEGKIDEFYEREIQTRKLLNFPPFSRLLRLVFRSQHPGTAQAACEQAYNILEEINDPEVELLGPSECPLEMVNNNHRWQILLRGDKISPLQKTAAKLIYGFKKPADLYIEVDVDPQNML